MKHDWFTTAILTALFLFAQLIGVGTAAYAYQTNTLTDEPAGLGERPDLTGWASIIYLLVAIGASTAAILFIARNNAVWIWKAWFSLATFIALYLFTSIYVNDAYAATIAAGLTVARLIYRHPIVHNAIELAMYAGIALFLAPLFSVNAAVILLAIMSAYDIYAVRQSKHMVRLAEFTRNTELFPGVNLAPQQTGKTATSEETTMTGVLGGGDILFPLLFSLAVFAAAAPQTSILIATMYSVLISLGATAGLLTLLYTSSQNRYYPALPFITTGCLMALVIVRTVHTF